MKTIPFNVSIQNRLIESAKKYKTLLKKSIILSSGSFVNKQEYILRFYETNFLHLTGVKTPLSPLDFFHACLDGTISLHDFDCDSSRQLKNFVRLKTRNLANVDAFFNNEIEVQEDFEKGSIRCLLGASNNQCTIGFVDAKYCLRPKTILDKNHLMKDRPIIRVLPSIKES